MRYLLLIYNNPATPTSEKQLAGLIDGHKQLYRELTEAGVVVSAASLADPTTATTVMVRDGVPAVTDGPYLETKEYLAGYYLVECDTLAQATEIAARIPCSVDSGVEVRPVDEVVTGVVQSQR